ncbi:hypothetical protein Anas_12545 [Armadillidium nasatum]|uniref:Uncharacterized protein n=1 Tax=Armadillidium nasatum TaxID=96803 RepID=A0A5N5TF52_9CRUS|nr:hypothetical protein Anas_12545 [Armadillidium nasatum]
MEGSALLSMIREREAVVPTDEKQTAEETSPQPTESQLCADAVDALLSAFAESFETESPITAFEVGKTYSLYAYGLGTLERDGEISSNIRIGPVSITNQADVEKRTILEFTYNGRIELLLDESTTPPSLSVLSFDLGTLEDGGVTLINQANPEDKELLLESVLSAMSRRLKLRSLYQNLFTSLAVREDISSKFSFPTEEDSSKKLEYVIS